MGEGVKAAFSVIGANAARSDTAEGEVRGDKVIDSVIHTAAAKRNTVKNRLLDLVIFRKNIKGERFRMIMDAIEHF